MATCADTCMPHGLCAVARLYLRSPGGAWIMLVVIHTVHKLVCFHACSRWGFDCTCNTSVQHSAPRQKCTSGFAPERALAVLRCRARAFAFQGVQVRLAVLVCVRALPSAQPTLLRSKVLCSLTLLISASSSLLDVHLSVACKLGLRPLSSTLHSAASSSPGALRQDEQARKKLCRSPALAQARSHALCPPPSSSCSLPPCPARRPLHLTLSRPGKATTRSSARKSRASWSSICCSSGSVQSGGGGHAHLQQMHASASIWPSPLGCGDSDMAHVLCWHQDRCHRKARSFSAWASIPQHSLASAVEHVTLKHVSCSGSCALAAAPTLTISMAGSLT